MLNEDNVIKRYSIVVEYKKSKLVENQDFIFLAEQNKLKLLRSLSIIVDTLFISYKTYPIQKIIQLYSEPNIFTVNKFTPFRKIGLDSKKQ